MENRKSRPNRRSVALFSVFLSSVEWKAGNIRGTETVIQSASSRKREGYTEKEKGEKKDRKLSEPKRKEEKGIDVKWKEGKRLTRTGTRGQRRNHRGVELGKHPKGVGNPSCQGKGAIDGGGPGPPPYYI